MHNIFTQFFTIFVRCAFCCWSVYKNLVEKFRFAGFCGFAYFICGRVEYKLKKYAIFPLLCQSISRTIQPAHEFVVIKMTADEGNNEQNAANNIVCLSQNDSTFKTEFIACAKQ